MKAIGMNTTTIEKVVAATARAISDGAVVRRRAVVLALLDVPHDVLAHDDGVVDEDADGQRQAEQRHRVQREAEGPDRHERGQHRHRQRQAGDDRRAPRVEEHEHDEHGQRGAFDERVLHVGDRVGDARPGVARDHELDARRQRGLDGVDLLADAGADVGGAGAVGLDDVDADGVAAVVLRRRPRLLGRVLGDGDVAEADQAPAALGHDQPRRSRPACPGGRAGGWCARSAAR